MSRALVAAVVAGGLIYLGVLVAGRPVGDERFRHGASEIGIGSLVGVHRSWGGSQSVTVAWGGPKGPVLTTFHTDVWPSFQIGDDFEVDFNPSHPLVNVVPDPSVFSNVPFRVYAVTESLVLFTFAALLLALVVVWPIEEDGGRVSSVPRPVKFALCWYLATPVLVALAVPAAAMTVPYLASYSFLVEAVDSVLALLMVVTLIWLLVPAVRNRQLARLVVVPTDAIDPHARVISMRGHRLSIQTGVRRRKYGRRYTARHQGARPPGSGERQFARG